MQFVMQALTAIAVIFGALFGTATVHADPLARPASAEARSHLTMGNKLYGVRSFDQAVEEYKAGSLVESAPVFDYNLGQCFRQLGKYQEAIWHYQRFLTRGDPQGELLDLVNDFIKQMKSELDRKAMTQPPIAPGPTQRSESAAEPARSRWTTTRRIAVGAGAFGVVGFAAGVVFGVQTSALKDDAARLCPVSPCDPSDKASKANALADRANQRATLANISFGVGGGMIVGAAILWYVGGPSIAGSSSRTDSALIPYLTPTFAGIACHGSF